MLIAKMTENECREFLARSSFGRLACTRENQPYIVPIYFVYEPNHLYGFSTFGQKIEWMRSNPRVCLEIGEVPNHFRWTSLIVSGRYEELPDEPEHRTERDQARMLLEKRFLWWQTAYAAMQLRSKHERNPPLFYCIHIEGMTGRKATPDSVEAGVGFEDDPQAKY
jgi:nitroimidazol reductase NimA-like FMN-containing flavoprotein (pyridoxamine 5'-phosphate oxidase superfamily)